MFHFHFRDGFGHAARFIGVVFRRLSRGHGAKRATARTHISQNHKGSRSRPPTFAHVWTVAAFANGMQLVFIHQSPHIRIRLARRKFYAQPIGLARFYFCDCGFHFFTFQSVFYTRPLSAKKRFLLSHWKAAIFNTHPFPYARFFCFYVFLRLHPFSASRHNYDPLICEVGVLNFSLSNAKEEIASLLTADE